MAATRCQCGALVAFLDLQPDAIVPVSTLPAIAAKRETTKIPIVTATGSDPVRLGVVASYAKSGGNIAGGTLC